MKLFFRWLILFSKRLYRSVPFLLTMLLVPILVVTFSFINRYDHSVINVLIVQEEPNNLISNDIAKHMERSSDTICFILEDNKNKAFEQLNRGRVDAVWVFPENIDSLLENGFLQSDSPGMIHVFQREDTVFLRLARKKLSAVMYRYCAQSVYLHYLREAAPLAESFSDEELLEYWNHTDVSGELFQFTDIQGTKADTADGYLLQPLQGILAILSTLLSVATAMQFQRDQDHGVYAVFSKRHNFLIEIAGQLTVSFHYGVAMLIAVNLSGYGQSVGKQIISLILLCFCNAAFAMMLRSIFSKQNILTSLIPALTIIMLLFCPVFLCFPQQRMLSCLFPPSYFLNLLQSTQSLIYSSLYIVVMLSVVAVIRLLKEKISLKGLCSD